VGRVPRDQEECDPSFVHHPASVLPVHDDDGISVRILVGTLFGRTSPVVPASPTFYADATLAAGARLTLAADYAARAIHVALGRLTLAGEAFDAGRLLIFPAGDAITITAEQPTRVLLFGGALLDGPRHLWGNFVSSSESRIEQASPTGKRLGFPRCREKPSTFPCPSAERAGRDVTLNAPRRAQRSSVTIMSATNASSLASSAALSPEVRQPPFPSSFANW